MTEAEIFALAELHLGPRFNRGRIKAFADDIYGRGIRKGADMMKAVYAPATQAPAPPDEDDEL